MTGTVLYEVSNGVARITLKRPPVNALNLEMIKGVVTALENAAKDEEARAVVLTSAVPNHFCAGLDLKIMLGKSEEKARNLLIELYVHLHDAQYNLGKRFADKRQRFAERFNDRGAEEIAAELHQIGGLRHLGDYKRAVPNRIEQRCRSFDCGRATASNDKKPTCRRYIWPTKYRRGHKSLTFPGVRPR